jgi:Transposase DDE domain
MEHIPAAAVRAGHEPDPGGQNGQEDRARRHHARRRRKARAALAALGRSRGGLTSKIHLAADESCRPLCFIPTAGQAGDRPQFTRFPDAVRITRPAPPRPLTRPAAVAGDKAYSSKANRAYLRHRQITAVTPIKTDQAAARKRKGRAGGRPPNFDPELCGRAAAVGGAACGGLVVSAPR